MFVVILFIYVGYTILSCWESILRDGSNELIYLERRILRIDILRDASYESISWETHWHQIYYYQWLLPCDWKANCQSQTRFRQIISVTKGADANTYLFQMLYTGYICTQLKHTLCCEIYNFVYFISLMIGGCWNCFYRSTYACEANHE